MKCVQMLYSSFVMLEENEIDGKVLLQTKSDPPHTLR